MTTDILRFLAALLLAFHGAVTDTTPTASESPVAVLRGLATWYAAPSKQDAAAGPDLRKALGPGWRGSWLTVTRVADGTVRSVVVVATDFCACGDRHGKPTLLDLSRMAFSDLAPLGTGVITVTVTAIDGVPTGPTPTAPPTSTEP